MIPHRTGDAAPTERGVAETEIRKRIVERGRIPFSEFMELALYHPVGGYYSTRRPVGAQGDYYTSPAAHPAFGALLAVQMERCWELLWRPSPFYVVEMGSGDGLLAQAFLAYAENLNSDFCDALEYVALDRRRSAVVRAQQPWSQQRVTSDGIPLVGVQGCFISNELVDAFPVHRFRIVDDHVREIFVTEDDDGRLIEEAGDPSTLTISERLASLDCRLPEGYTGEVNLGITNWARDVSAALDRGFVVTIDYGYPAQELYAPSRSQGTLQTYFQHTESGGPFNRIGRQDITAHVDFTALERDGEMAGLISLGIRSQSEYLRELGAGRMIDALRQMPMSAHDRDANMMALRELVNPTGLGGFRVLVQHIGVDGVGYSELMPSQNRLESLTPPLLDSAHTPLFEGRYPQHEFELESLWPFGDPDDDEAPPDER
ncbi:MAG: class I SAM-dependent methyltransferase [SAR202 cluster bacterium]|nr:SAM-dependent methyltransferase [SAR202 cluster bacterium]MQG67853.1 class I SAM-dependent methyltransferase [SAR202 cluster bacterium]